MFDAGELFAGRAADALRGRFRRDEVGKILLQRLKLLEKLVVFVVGDELPALDVIGAVVPADFVGESGVAFLASVSVTRGLCNPNHGRPATRRTFDSVCPHRQRHRAIGQ
jgi:hypothetical protein